MHPIGCANECAIGSATFGLHRRNAARGPEAHSRALRVSRHVHWHGYNCSVGGDSVGKRPPICRDRARYKKQQNRCCPHEIKYTAQVPIIRRYVHLSPVRMTGYSYKAISPGLAAERTCWCSRVGW